MQKVGFKNVKYVQTTICLFLISVFPKTVKSIMTITPKTLIYF